MGYFPTALTFSSIIRLRALSPGKNWKHFLSFAANGGMQCGYGFQIILNLAACGWLSVCGNQKTASASCGKQILQQCPCPLPLTHTQH